MRQRGLTRELIQLIQKISGLGWIKLENKATDSIAFPHNSNGSNGQMFEMETFFGEPLSKEYAAL